MIIVRKLMLSLCVFLCAFFAHSVSAEYHSTSFGGNVTVEDEPVTYTYHASSFGGSVTIEESYTWSNWSTVFIIGYTSVCDIDIDMDVDNDDLSLLLGNYLNTTGVGESDINDDGIVNYLDRSLIQNRLGDDYT